MRIIYMGTPDFAIPPLEKLVAAGHQVAAVITQPDRPRQRGKVCTPTPVKSRSLELGLPVYTPEKVNTPEVLELLSNLKPDLLVVVAYGQFLSEKLFTLPPYGAVNIHASLLPAYRGAAPIHWAILHGESRTGVTIMYIDKGMDSGDMILRQETEIGPEEDTGSLHDRLSQMGADLLLQAIEQIHTGTVVRIPQDPKAATLAPMLRKEQERVDWTQSAQTIHDQIRGLHPWPGCYTTWQGKRLKLHASRVQNQSAPAHPGQILEISSQGITVACGQDCLRLIQVQPEGKAVMEASAFIRGYHPLVGQILGE